MNIRDLKYLRLQAPIKVIWVRGYGFWKGFGWSTRSPLRSEKGIWYG